MPGLPQTRQGCGTTRPRAIPRYAPLRRDLRQLAPEVAAPGLGEGLDLHDSRQRCDIVFVEGVRARHVGHGDPVCIPTERLDRIPRLDRSFPQDPQVKAGPAAGQKGLTGGNVR
jgi:hypothetical protein